MKFSTTIASLLVFSAAQVYAAPALAERDITNIINIPRTTLSARVLVGDPTCPASTGSNVNVNVFAAVKLHEVLKLKSDVVVKSNLPVVGTIRQITTAQVEADVLVCLCLNAGISSNLIPVSADLKARAEADIKAKIKAATIFNLALSPVKALLAIVGVKVDFSLTPVDATPCKCNDPKKRPICSSKGCDCEDCPANLVYNPSTGTCTPKPSGLPIRKRTLDAAAQLAVRARQAKKADVIKRTGPAKPKVFRKA